MDIYPGGHDYGNSESDLSAFVEGKEVKASMPTIETTVSLDNFDNLKGKDLAPNSVLIQMAGDDTAYMIGEEVLIQGKNGMSHRKNIRRYYEKPSVRALIGNACRVIPDKSFGLSLVTGVPVATYIKDRGIRDLIKKGLSGTHSCHIIYRDGDELKKEDRVVDIEVDLVVMEGAGVILDHGEGGEIRQAVIDIGGGTCDIYASKGQTPLIDKCQSENYGVEASIDLLKENFLNVHKRELLQGEARDMMLAYIGAKKDYPRLSVRGREIKDGQQRFLVEEAIRVVGKQIQSFVATTLNEGVTSDSVAANIHKVYVVGRGSLFFRRYLQEIISADQLKLIENPGSANASGYATWAQNRLSKKIATP